MGWKIGGNTLSFSTEPSSARMSAADTFFSVMESSVTDSISGREAMIRSCDSVRTRAPLVAGHGNSVRCRRRMTSQPNMTDIDLKMYKRTGLLRYGVEGVICSRSFEEDNDRGWVTFVQATSFFWAAFSLVPHVARCMLPALISRWPGHLVAYQRERTYECAVAVLRKLRSLS